MCMNMYMYMQYACHAYNHTPPNASPSSSPQCPDVRVQGASPYGSTECAYVHMLRNIFLLLPFFLPSLPIPPSLPLPPLTLTSLGPGEVGGE